MKITVTLISSSFESNQYPKGIACAQCHIQTKNIELSFSYVRKADDSTIEAFVENDNLCQKLAIQKALKQIKYIESAEFEPQEIETQEQQETNLTKKISYKQKVIEIVNLLNWNIEKLSRFVYRYKNKKLNELTEKEWAQIYNQLSNFLQSNLSLPKSEPQTVQDEIIKPEEWEQIL
ncbi:MAG: hypothetical protein ABDH21_03680 [bacterium]